MATFVISNLDTQNFTFEHIRFVRLTYDSQIEKQWHEKYGATFKAIANDDLDVKPVIRDKGPLGLIEDICLLLSLVQSRFIYCPEYTKGEVTNVIPHYRIGKPTAYKVVDDNKIEAYLSTATKTLRKPGWIEKTKFVPAAYYLLLGDSDEVSEVSFMLTWIALETLANAYAKEKGTSTILHSNTFKELVKPAIIEVINQLEKEKHLTNEQKELIIEKIVELNRPSTCYKICKLRDAYKWDFITDKLLRESNQIRNKIMHSGTLGAVQRNKVIDLCIKLHESMYLALLDLLKCSNYISYLDSIKKQIEGN